MSPGKQFEADFKSSIPHEEVWYYRFRDGTANFSGQKNENVRFQAKNIADCEIYQYPSLFIFELKSTKANVLTFSMVRDNQLKQMTEAAKHGGLNAGFIVNFREAKETYYISIQQYNHIKETLDRKSIPIQVFRDRGILLDATLKKVHYRYNVTKLLSAINAEQ